MRKRLLTIFDTLLAAFGPRRWWPGDSPLEIMVGAVLTQNTAWRNVEKAIANMKAAGVLTFEALTGIDEAALAEIIRPAGFYRLKSRRLKGLITYFHGRYDNTLENTVGVPTPTLRAELLDVNGIGPETADSILLYALDRPVFVVDAYTKRLLGNHRLYDGDDGYHDVQAFFTENLPEDTYLFNEFHALIVRLCQEHCRKKPLCEACPLRADLRRHRGR
jgi:endonuclease-3 related protein